MRRPEQIAECLTAAALLAMSVAVLLTSCTATRALNAYSAPNGAKVGQSKQVVFLRPYNAQEGTAVAMDNAGITRPDSIHVRRRVRAFGSAYITTVSGHE